MISYQYIILFLILIFLSNPFLQKNFAKIFGKESADSISGFFLALIFSVPIIIYLYYYPLKEGFLFSVSKCSPRTSGLYTGQPNTFQYDLLACHRNGIVGGGYDMIKYQNANNEEDCKSFCKDDLNPSYGFVKGSQDAKAYGGDNGMFTNYADDGKF
jgi:hypothetical protein